MAVSSVEIITVRIKKDVKKQAMENAAAVGIPLASLINAFVTKFAAEGRVPFEISVPQRPNKSVRAAIDELESGGGERCASIDDMYRVAGIKS